MLQQRFLNESWQIFPVEASPIHKTFPKQNPPWNFSYRKMLRKPREEANLMLGWRAPHVLHIFLNSLFFYWNHFYEFLLLFQQVRGSPLLSVGLMTTGIPKLDDQTRITFRLSISDFLGGFSSHNGIGLGMTSHSIVDSRLNSRRKVNIINRGLIRLLIGAELSAHCDRRSSGENGIRLLGNKSNY